MITFFKVENRKSEKTFKNYELLSTIMKSVDIFLLLQLPLP